MEDRLIEERLVTALALRERVCPGRRSFRWVHGEADGLPGLVIDRFEGADGRPRVVLVANTAGMERLRPRIEGILRERFDVMAGFWKCDSRGRALEGLPDDAGSGWGVEAGSEPAWCTEDDGLSIQFEPHGGQKTGLFLDMWDNRRHMSPALASGRVLDLFSYVGQWGLHAARAGATEVVCVDRSQAACAMASQNAERNGLAGQVTVACAPCEDYLATVRDGSLDAVICDPPSFIRSKKHLSRGSAAYRTLFARVLRKVRPGGLAVLASCSYHLNEERFERVLTEAAKWANCRLSVIRRAGQAPCHPVPLWFPEARYLKCWLVSVDVL
ncbi:MAG TPA: RlmI/RlmK family 23S rRNA methyltransferase [Deltaproteobacteria bacterium]|nr:RlmI/RlmK family 23S rRNA methyltransferase [Deltaproteobacteria bacterium]